MIPFSRFARRLPVILRVGRIPIVCSVALLIFFFLHFVMFNRQPVVDNMAFSALRDVLQNAELDTVDARFSWRGPQPLDPNIVLVEINNTAPDPENFKPEVLTSSEALRLMTEKTYPWNRKVWALLIDKLMAAGAKAIVFDLIFVNESEGDAEFAATIAKYPKQIVLGNTTLPDDGNLILLRPHPNLIPPGIDDMEGYCVYHPDPDTVVRRVDYRTSFLRERGESGYPDDMTVLAARAFEKTTGKKAPNTKLAPINFQAGSNAYPTFRLEELFIDSTYRNPRIGNGAVFKDKIVFVGPTAEIFHDTLDTPFGVMAGVEIHMQVAASLLAGKPLRESSASTYWILAICSILLPTLIVLFIRQAFIQAQLLLALTFGFVVVAQWLFSSHSILMPIVPPLLGLISVGSFGVVFHSMVEQLKGAHVRSVLDRYVSKKVAKLAVDRGESFTTGLKGQRKSITILFSDVRGFTSIFESANPETIVTQLNEYFLEMVNTVLVEDGSLHKFIGDAIMAAWGDIDSEGASVDATRAVRAALRMQKELIRLNAMWAGKPDRIPMRIGIGINHGEATLGEIGHPQRMEFTALGDAVNLAARLESATKQFHCEILAGQMVEELTRSQFVYRRVDKLVFKGKSRPVEVFIPLSASTEPPPAWLADYHQAVDEYRSKQFSLAITHFEAVQTRLGGEDYLCEMYLARCREFLDSPPPPDWDGSHVLSEK